MAGRHLTVQVIYSFLLLSVTFQLGSSAEEDDPKTSSKEELIESESKDGKLEIIKRIKKVNDDGSYTIGYEADDGSFKIESRDVLGNIKGTYGFIDEEGKIKRVSYSTSNSSEVLTKPPEPTILSVVQRIPKLNKTSSTTRRPGLVYPPTIITPTSTNNVIQSIARRRLNFTTAKPAEDKTTIRGSGQVIYSSAAPRVLLQRPTSTAAPQVLSQKLEGQLVRPEVVTIARPTELPLFRRINLENKEDQSDLHSNILRRQLAQDENPNYSLREHVYSLQQSLGHDAPDVYSGSMTTGNPRPLFTTTLRPRILSSTTPQTPIVINRPTIRFQQNYQRNVLQDVEPTQGEFAQESSTTEPTVVRSTTPTSVPVVQIPANREATPEPLVAIKHPFQRGAILVPLSQLQNGRILPVENMRDVSEAQEQYDGAQHQAQYLKETTPRPIVLRRLPPPSLRPIPVQVDENGYIREVAPQTATPYPIPIPVTPSPHKLTQAESEVDAIEPPVSTRDFQKLLHQLILRQNRLERISALMQNQQEPQRYRQVYQPTPVPYFVQKAQQDSPQTHFEPIQRPYNTRPQPEYYNQYEDQSYVPTRRVARLLPRTATSTTTQTNEEYLPADVREMLLLRMLQLAINPALPLEDQDEDLIAATTPKPQFKRAPVRNVEILGEEPDHPKRTSRIKRYREHDPEEERDMMEYSD